MKKRGAHEIKRLPIPIYRIDKKLRQRGMTEQERAWDQYLIPGTDILRNELSTERNSYGITDRKKLTRIEERVSLRRASGMLRDPVPGSFDLAHMQEIHRRLFTGIYPWAGQIRNVNLFKNNIGYGRYQDIEASWSAYSQNLADKNFLDGMTNKHQFVKDLADAWGAINHAHAFREGNTRSQTIFFHQLCHQAGWELDVARLAPNHPTSLREDFINGRFEYQIDCNAGRTPNSQLLQTVFTELLSPTPEKLLGIRAHMRKRRSERVSNLHTYAPPSARGRDYNNNNDYEGPSL